MKSYARNTDPQTSHDAANSVSEFTTTKSGQVILFLLGMQGMTDVELVDAYHALHRENPEFAPRASDSGIRTRRCQLFRQGFLKDSGDRQLTPSGRQAVVWIGV